MLILFSRKIFNLALKRKFSQDILKFVRFTKNNLELITQNLKELDISGFKCKPQIFQCLSKKKKLETKFIEYFFKIKIEISSHII